MAFQKNKRSTLKAVKSRERKKREGSLSSEVSRAEPVLVTNAETAQPTGTARTIHRAQREKEPRK
jgi:hypothetical protein